MSLEKSTIEVKPGSEKSFGYVFTVVFALIGFYPLASHGEPRLWSLVISVFILIVTILRPQLFTKPNYYWFRLGLLLGSIIAPIVMGVIYILTIIPIGLLMQVLGKDPLRRKVDKSITSYWIKRDTPLQPMKHQF